MNKYNWLLIGAAALAMGACSQEDDILEESTENGKTLFRFEATMEADTRTTFNADYTRLNWVEGDRLSFFTDAGDKNVQSDGYKGNNMFTAELSADAKRVFAFYYLSGTVTETSEEYYSSFYRMDIPFKQVQQEAGVLNGENIPMYAVANLSSEGVEKLTFRSVTSLMAFNVYNSDGGSDETLESITFVTETGICKVACVDADGGVMIDDPTGRIVMVGLNTPYKIPQTKPSDKSGLVYLAVTPDNYCAGDYEHSFEVITNKYAYHIIVDRDFDLTSPYQVQPIAMNLAKAERFEKGGNWNSYFEDENFLNFLLKNIDVNQDGILSSHEVSIIKVLDCGEQSIKSLKGIEVFKNLETLYCYSNQLTSLDVSQNTNLKYLDCSDNSLTSLVSKNPNLRNLNCDSNQLETLDVSGNENLESLDCGWNLLSSIDVSKNVKLTDIYCGDNPRLTDLDVSKSVNLKYLNCEECSIVKLNISGNTLLEDLSCEHNQLTSLDVSKNTNLRSLNCRSNQLTTLILGENTKLEYLECGLNQLTSLDVSKNTKLYYLDCSENQLTTLNVGECTELKFLYCENNRLTALDVSLCSKEMQTVDCSSQTMPESTVFKFTKAVGQTIGYLVLPDEAETIEK